jgi:hypothetical protein
MNLRRGLFRLWIVGSALFVLADAFFNYSDIEDWASVGRVAAFAFSIPLAILGFGTALLWALSGLDVTRN